MPAWYDSRFTGLFAGFDRVPPRPHDPDVEAWAGTVPGTTGRPQEVPTGGAGWDARQAEAACVGEAVVRFQAMLSFTNRTTSSAGRVLVLPMIFPRRAGGNR